MLYFFFKNIVNSVFFISSVFATSTATVLLITKIMNKPFINPANTPEKNEKHLNTIVKTVYNVVVTTTIPFVTTIYVFRLDEKNHNIFVSTVNLVCYSVLIELAYYAYHRIQHTVLFLKKIHQKHHEHTSVYPFDTFYIDYYDAVGLSVCLLYPCFILNMNSRELFLIIYFYATGAFLQHSDILSRHHQIHHKRFTCNYCFIFPIFDILCGTEYIKDS